MTLNILSCPLTLLKRWTFYVKIYCLSTVFAVARTTARTFSKKFTENYKEKANGKEHSINQSDKNSELINNLSVFDLVGLNKTNKITNCHLNIDFKRNTFEMLREIVKEKLDILLIRNKFRSIFSVKAISDRF